MKEYWCKSSFMGSPLYTEGEEVGGGGGGGGLLLPA